MTSPFYFFPVLFNSSLLTCCRDRMLIVCCLNTLVVDGYHHPLSSIILTALLQTFLYLVLCLFNHRLIVVKECLSVDSNQLLLYILLIDGLFHRRQTNAILLLLLQYASWSAFVVSIVALSITLLI